MARRRRGTRDEDEELDDEYNEETQNATDDGEVERKRRRRNRKRSIAPEDDSDEEEDEYLGHNQRRKKKKSPVGVAQFLDDEALVASDEDDEDIEIEDGFIVDDIGAELPDEDDDGRRIHRRPLLAREDDQEDFEALARSFHARYARSSQMEDGDDDTEVEQQQALLPSAKDTKLWLVKCKMIMSKRQLLA